MKFRLLLATLFATFICNAQEWEAGISIGPSQYQGDLAKEQIVIKKTKLGGGLVGRYTINPLFAVRGELNVMKISGDDKFSKEPSHALRNVNFHSLIEELSLHLEYNFFKYVPGSKSRRFTPFISAGVGIFHFSPTTEMANGDKVTLQPLKTELDKPAYALTQVCFPIGGGIKYNIAGTWSLGINYATRVLMTDYLDDVSSQFQHAGTGVTAQELALTWRAPELDPVKYNYLPPNQPGTDPKKTVNRGDPKDNDTYLYLGISLTKTFRAYACNAF